MHERPVALVTGGARRLGAATVRALHAAGHAVLIHHHTAAAEAARLAAELNRIVADSAGVLRADLASAASAAPLIAEAHARWSRLDVLVNNASVFEATAPNVAGAADWERMQAINLRAPYLLAVAAAPHLGAQQGAIINITDIHAESPRKGYAIYCVSKAGLVAATRALALEFAPHVRVNAVAPGAILWAASEDAALRAATLRATPLARHGDPEDIAQAVCYLAGARFVTGQVLRVDGGRLLHS